MANDTKIVKRAFNAGEISIRAKWRNDTEKHAYSCEKLENFYVSPLGAISRREGTRLLDTLGTVAYADNVRLLPFEYNRELSYVLALRTEVGGSESIECTSDKFHLPEVFSICITIPDITGTKTFFEKGELSFKITADKVFQVIFGQTIALQCSIKSGDKIVFIWNNGYYTLYKNGTAEYPLKSEFAFTDNGESLIFHSHQMGDFWGLKILNFDISAKNAYYSVSDYQNDIDETQKLLRTPDYSGQKSRYGSSYSDDGLFYDFDLARNIRLEEIRENYDEYSEEIYQLKKSISENEELIKSSREEISEIVDNDDYVAILEKNIAEYEQNILTSKTDLKSVFAIAYGFESWQDFFIASKYKDEESLFNDCFSESFVFPVSEIEEIITIPFYIPKNARINYSARSVDVKAWIDDNEIVSGLADKDYSNFCLKFTITDDCSLDYTCEYFTSELTSILLGKATSWTSDQVVKLNIYDINGNKRFSEIDTPIPAKILQEFQYKQVGGNVYISHSSISPKKLSLDGNNKFSWSEAVLYQPSIDTPEENLIFSFGNSSQSSNTTVSGSVGAITANKNYFTADMIGTQFKIDYLDKGAHTYKWKTGKTGQSSSSSVDVSKKTTISFTPCGKVSVIPEGGVWDGVLILEESIDDGKTWNEIGRTTSIQGSSNTKLEREVYNVKSLVRARMLEQNTVADTKNTVVDTNTEGCFFNIQTEATCCAWVEITAVNSEKSATVKFLNPCRSYFVSTAVYKSSWNKTFGYPRAVEIHEERLVFAGTSNQPSTIWLSQTNNWDNFRSVSNLDTDPLAYTLASDDGEPISWLVSRSDLMVGMGSSEWSFGSRDASQALTASIVQASNQSDDGVEYIMPTKAGGMVVFVRRGNRELASISYDYVNDSYNAISLTTMNPELLSSGVVNIFNQLSPNNKIYVVCRNGNLAVFTYDKENNVAAWGRFTFGDGVISACALSTGKFKSIFIIAKRDGYLCLERLDPNELETNNWLDCVPINKNMSVPDGLNTSVKYESLVKTTPVFLEGSVKVFDVKLYLINSLGGKFRIVGFNLNGDETADEWRNILPRESEFLQEAKPRNYRYVGACDVGYLEEGSIEISTDETAPFELTAIGIKAKG